MLSENWKRYFDFNSEMREIANNHRAPSEKSRTYIRTMLLKQNPALTDDEITTFIKVLLSTDLLKADGGMACKLCEFFCNVDNALIALKNKFTLRRK